MTKQQLSEIGQRLRERRNAMGLTREQFAELADIGAGYYGQIEVGTSQMSIDTLIKLSRTSRLTIEYILFGEMGQPVRAHDDDEAVSANRASIDALLENRTERELHMAEKVLQLFLLRGD